MQSWCRTSENCVNWEHCVLAVASLCISCVHSSWEHQIWLVSERESEIVSHGAVLRVISIFHLFDMRILFWKRQRHNLCLSEWGGNFSILLKIFVMLCVPLVSDWWSHNVNCSDFIGVIFFIITVWNSGVIHTTPRQ